MFPAGDPATEFLSDGLAGDGLADGVGVFPVSTRVQQVFTDVARVRADTGLTGMHLVQSVSETRFEVPTAVDEFDFESVSDFGAGRRVNGLPIQSLLRDGVSAVRDTVNRDRRR